jgi:hypothetical protein
LRKAVLGGRFTRESGGGSPSFVSVGYGV